MYGKSREWMWSLVPTTAFLTILSFSGCASIIKGSAPQQVSLKTAPSDADCQITDLRTGVVILKQRSPILTQLKRDSGYFKNARYRYSCEKEGYASSHVDIQSSLNGWYAGGNLVFLPVGTVIGWLFVDPATGAMWSFASDDITLALKPPVPVSSSGGEKGDSPVTTSYFQGVWVGYWYHYWGGQNQQEVTITVGPRNPDGTFDTEYSWGWKQAKVGERDTVPGTLAAKGREDGEKFVFEFSNPNDFKINSVEMTKYEGEKVKIKMSGPMYSPDGYLKRK